MVKIKKYSLSFCLLLILIIIGIVMVKTYSKNNEPNKVTKKVFESLDSNQKKLINYTYEIPNNLHVVDIFSEKELIVKENNELKIYNIENQKLEQTIVNINKNSKVPGVNTFSDRLIWIESNEKSKIKSKIYIKYFTSNKIELLDESDSEIIPRMAINSNYLTYFIINKEKISVKLINLQNNKQSILATYDLKNQNELNYISPPSIDNNNIFWSYTDSKNSSVVKYSINNQEIKKLSTNNSLYNPIINNDKLLAICKENFFDAKLNTTYGSNYIVEFDLSTNTWKKFCKDTINEYIKYPKECIVGLSNNVGLFYWLSTFGYNNYLYDFSTNKFITLANSKYLLTTIKIVKKNIIVFNVEDFNNKKSNFILLN